MIVQYSEQLKHNFLVLEPDEETTVDQILHTAHMHRCDRICCGGRTKVAIAKTKPDGSVENPRWVAKAVLGRML